MSRIGKEKIKIPEGVNVELKDNLVFVKGPKGELNVLVFDGFEVKIDNKEVSVISPEKFEKETSALWGTLRALINNAVIGVSEGYEKVLLIEGIGFKANLEGNNLIMNLGFSHPIKFPFVEGIEISVDKNKIFVKGIDKNLVGLTSAKIRAFKKPEPYKGKGIRYIDEVVRRKVGKKVVGAE
jgi:large subunit ribosomal protein L6